ncbi:hypothetical protein MJ1HA_1927 [Metallosphaera sedula]|nr:hypothetical protein MJ1HA_1927 [Metallosphaera sedula]
MRKEKLETRAVSAGGQCAIFISRKGYAPSAKCPCVNSARKTSP